MKIDRRTFLKFVGATAAALAVPMDWLGALATSDRVAGVVAIVGGDGYVKASADAEFESMDNGTLVNASEIIFPVATSNWGAVTHAWICIGDNEWWMPLYSPCKYIREGDTAQFPNAAIEVF